MQMHPTIRFSLALLGAAIQPSVGRAQQAVQPVTVQVHFSQQAAARLLALHEGVTISASFSGDPTAAARRQADERGQVELATEDVTIGVEPAAATISGAGVTEAKMRLLRNRAVKLLINVFSARRSGPDNILNCDIFDGAAAVAARSPVQIKCKLITEGF